MMCFFCKGDIQENVTNHVINNDNCVIIIKKVPCTECSQCGQAFYDDDVMSQLETMVNDMRKAVAEITVVSYVDKVA
jgi:YgiT-type zinc finger domain-containing protein